MGERFGKYELIQRIGVGGMAEVFLATQGGAVQLLLSAAITFYAPFDPQEHLGIHGLRACITTPQTPGNRGNEKQGQTGNNQHQGQEDEILWPECETENIEFTGRQVEEHRLMTAPVYPWQYVVQTQKQDHCKLAQACKAACYIAWVNLGFFAIQGCGSILFLAHFQSSPSISGLDCDGS